MKTCKSVINKLFSRRSQHILKKVEAVCLDFDSTIVKQEGIDELARLKGLTEEVRKITRDTMNGKTPFDKSLSERLKLIKPSVHDIENLNRYNVFTLSNNVDLFIDNLHSRGVDVYVISGGIRQLILPVTRTLNIPDTSVYANTILFNDKGEYNGIKESMLTKNYGKTTQIIELINKHQYDSIIMIGDGQTDLETKSVVDMFIGYGGVVERPVMKKQCENYITDFGVLIS
jgi:phosphoserine phosphatase